MYRHTNLYVAHAQYIDPGTGSFIYQILIAGFLFILFFFYRIKSSIRRWFKKAKDQQIK